MVALRKYLNRSSKSDKIDSLTLAKMPFIDPEKLEEIYFPPSKLYAIQRLALQRKRLENDIAGHKKRLGSIVDGYLPGIRSAFSDPWSVHARAFLRSRLNPLAAVRYGEKALHAFLAKTRKNCRIEASVESHAVYLACREAATLYKATSSVGTVDDEFFAALQDECQIKHLETVCTENSSLEELKALLDSTPASDSSTVLSAAAVRQVLSQYTSGVLNVGEKPGGAGFHKQ